MSIEALPLHNSIGPTVANLFQGHFNWHSSQSYKHQIKLYLSTKIYVGVLLISSHGSPTHIQSHDNHIHHSARILKISFITKVAVILHLRAWSFTIISPNSRKLHMDLDKDQSIYKKENEVQQSYYSIYGSFNYINLLSLHL